MHMATSQKSKPERPDRKGARFAPLSCVTSSDDASALVDSLLVQIEAFELRTGARQNKRIKTRAAFRSALASFLGDLLLAAHARKATGWVYRSMKTEGFTGGAVASRTFGAVVAGLKGLECIDHEPGKRYVVANPFDRSALPAASGGVAAHFKARESLLTSSESFNITSVNVGQHFKEPLPKEPIILTSGATRVDQIKTKGKPMSFELTSRVAQLEAEVRALNEFFLRFELCGGKHDGYRRMFHEGDLISPYGWNKGGRLYSGPDSYMRNGKATRLQMTLGGEPVAEIDVNASYLTVYYGLSAVPYDPLNGDPYEVGLERDAVKSWMVATFGSNGHLTRWLPDMNKVYTKKHGHSLSKSVRLATVQSRMLAKHPVLQGWADRTITWADLMFAESNAIIGTMTELMRLDIPSLSVHDSLIVRRSDTEVATKAMERNFLVACGIVPKLTVSHG